MNAPRDPHSGARPDEARVRHVDLDLAIDFDHRVIRGVATLNCEVAPGARTLVLDARRLAIATVTDGAGTSLPHRLQERDPVLGAALEIELRAGASRVVITYATHPEAEGLQWLEPAQTAGGTKPFLFTQGHAIQTRSWIPIQDSPGIRITYDARVRVPSGLVALMSAEHLGEVAADADGTTFAFRMREAIPPYLVALAVGDLARAEVGPRTAVFAEPSWLARSAYELGEMERMIDAAEALVGPYRWGRFDVVVMPPSFPYGGMENPRLTFASPTIIVGDRSLTTVVAHELAHAWAGNLVTNATWRDFWINEGTTVYLELRLHEALWGTERATMLESWGHRELLSEIRHMGAASPDTRLRYDMVGRDPAEGVTVIPYLKGAAFFSALEGEVGRPRLDAWLRTWFDRHAFQSVTTDELLADVRAHLAPTTIDLDAWVDAPGPPMGPGPRASALAARVEQATAALLAGAAPASIDVEGWTPQAWRQLLGAVLAGAPTTELADAIDATFHLSEKANPEILLPWLRLEARLQRAAATPKIEQFLLDHGRLRYLKPIYVELLASAWGRAIATRAYAVARPRYHALVRASLDKLLAADAS